MDILTILCNTIVILFETLAMVAVVIGIYGLSGGEINTKFIKDIYRILFEFPTDDDDAYDV